MTKPNLGAFFRRNSVSIGIVVVILAFGSILFLQAMATAKLQQQSDQNNLIIKQIKDVTKSLDGHAADRTAQINQLNRHLDCIVVFFAEPDRANKSISDIDTCTVKSSTTGQTTNPLGNTGVLTPPAATDSGNAPAQNTTPKQTTPVTPQQPVSEAPEPSFLDRLVAPITNLIKRL